MNFQLYISHPLLSLSEYCSDMTPHNFSQEYVNDNDAVVNLNESNANETFRDGGDTVDDFIRASLLMKEEGPVNQPNTALFCTILALGTFFIAYYLRQFRNSKFLGRSVSEFICLCFS